MLKFLERWLKKEKNEDEVTVGTKPNIVLELMDEEIEELRSEIEKLRFQDLANKTIIRSQNKQIRELNEKIKKLIDTKHPLPVGELDNFQLKSSNLLLKIALRDLVTYSGKVIQEAKHHEMHNVISIHMKRVLDALEKASGSPAIEALAFADKVEKEQNGR